MAVLSRQAMDADGKGGGGRSREEEGCQGLGISTSPHQFIRRYSMLD